MKRAGLLCIAGLLAGPVLAQTADFKASCPGNIQASSSAGKVVINDHAASIKRYSDTAFDATAAGIVLSVMAEPGQDISVMYTGKHGANGVCQVTQGAAPASSGATKAGAQIQTQTVQFKKGTSSATLSGSLQGDTIIDYVLRAKAGQIMTLAFRPSNASAYVNVLPPGSDNEAIFIGSNEGNDWSGTLPASGEYKVRAYLMRSAARNNESSHYTLTIGIAAANATPAEPSSAASGNIPCAQNQGQPMGQCPFSAERQGQGTALLKVTLPDGRMRVIFFDKGMATGADQSQADGDMSFQATKQADLFMIRVGKERYEVPEAAIFGG